MSRRAYQQRRAERAVRHAAHHAPSHGEAPALGRCVACREYRFLSDDDRHCVACAAPVVTASPMGVAPCAP